MQFTSETSSNGVIERNFTLDEITGVLWSPTSGAVGAPLLLSGHSGGMHKKAPGLVASALHGVATYGSPSPPSTRPVTVTGRETFRINSGPRRFIRPGRRAS